MTFPAGGSSPSPSEAFAAAAGELPQPGGRARLGGP
jgi:hypothetical protein